MKLVNLKNPGGEQNGFTLIEVLVALAISGLLAVGMIGPISQIGTVNDISNARVVAVKQLENAIHYINRDVQQAQKVETNVEVDGTEYWLVLTWTSWSDNALNEITYNVDSNQNLIRQESVTIDGSTTTSQTTVARYIIVDSQEATPPNPTPTPTPLPPEKSWTITLSSTYTAGSKTASETREIKVVPRPGS